MLSLEEYLGRREKGPEDKPDLVGKASIHGQIKEVAASPDSPVAELKTQEAPFFPGEVCRPKFRDAPIGDVQRGIVFDDGQAVVDEPGEVEPLAFFHNKIPVDDLLEGLDGKEDVADEDQTVKGMADPQGVFTKINDQVFRAEHQGVTVRHAGHGGVFP
jgi:hypothetical protein